MELEIGKQIVESVLTGSPAGVIGVLLIVGYGLYKAYKNGIAQIAAKDAKLEEERDEYEAKIKAERERYDEQQREFRSTILEINRQLNANVASNVEVINGVRVVLAEIMQRLNK